MHLRYPMTLPWCAETYVWKMQKKTTHPHISTIILGTNERSNTLWQQAFSTRQATATRAQAYASLRSPGHHAPHYSTLLHPSSVKSAYYSDLLSLAKEKKTFVTCNMLHLKSFIKRISCSRSFGKIMPTYFHFSAFFGNGLGSLQEHFSQSSSFLTTNLP